MPHFDAIAFDADDTLWYYERVYREMMSKVTNLLAPYGPPQEIDAYLNRVELANIHLYGYGIKGFALSMIEAAIQFRDGHLSNQEVQAIIEYAREMMRADIQLIERVPETISALGAKYQLALITKGDLFEQEDKISRSGLKAHFHWLEIVGTKTSEIYARILERYHIVPERFLMVGNSLRSDILPVLELGGQAVYIPGELTWEHESAEIPPAEQAGFYQLEHIGELPGLLERIEEGT